MTTRIQTKNVHGKPRFGDARDKFLKIAATETDRAKIAGAFPCTSRSLSSMPQRQRGPENKSGYVAPQAAA